MRRTYFFLGIAVLQFALMTILSKSAYSQTQNPQVLIDAACPCNGPITGGQWQNHGQYVSCVTSKVNALISNNIIPKNKKGQYVSAAAQSDCGKPNQTNIDPTQDEDSHGILTLSGAEEKKFNPRNVSVTLHLANAQFSGDLNDLIIEVKNKQNKLKNLTKKGI